jgi:hypothetical protein
MKTVCLVGLGLTILAATVEAKTESRAFTLGGQSGTRQEFEFTVRAEGAIRVEARWTGSAARLTVILNGPGQTGYYQRREGGSPVAVTQDVTPEILGRGPGWKVTVVNFGQSGSAQGTLTITYPDAFTPRRYDNFDRISISRIEMTASDRAAVTVEYTLGAHHSGAVFVGAAVLDEGRDLSSFGFRPAAASGSSGRAQVEIVFSGRSGPVTSDQIAAYLYERDRTPHCRITHDIRLTWSK